MKTRFAPSPTGFLHVGGARTALFCFLQARAHNGTFILRIEDTDLERSTPESVQAILDGMEWLGLDYDEGPYYQTRRFDRYAEVVQQLLGEGKAYHCYCSKERIDRIRDEQMQAGAMGDDADFHFVAPGGVEFIDVFAIVEDEGIPRLVLEIDMQDDAAFFLITDGIFTGQHEGKL